MTPPIYCWVDPGRIAKKSSSMCQNMLICVAHYLVPLERGDCASLLQTIAGRFDSNREPKKGTSLKEGQTQRVLGQFQGLATDGP
jgi:hypothetical protein